MPRCLAPLAVLLFLAGPLCAEDDVAKTVAGLVTDLGDEDVVKREAALTALVHLGVRAEKAVRAELERATDPEIQGRLMAALQAYAVVEEESWALERIRKPGTFPPPKPGADPIYIKPVATVEEALDRFREQTGLTVELYAGDEELARALERSLLTRDVLCNPDAAEWALWYLLCAANLTSVLDGQRVVIVRYTPAILFERLATERSRTVNDWLAQDLSEFENKPHEYWTSAQCYLREKANAGGLARDGWFSLLRNRALDPSESAPNRRAALRGLSEFLGSVKDPQPDVDDVSLAIARDAQAPAPVRAEAAANLAMGLTAEAQDGILDLLGGADAAFQGDLLQALIDSRGFMLTALNQMAPNPVRMARLRKSLQALSNSKLEAVSLRAIVFLAGDNDEAAAARLATLPDPTERQARLIFLRALHAVPLPPARERFASFRSDPDPEIRAAVARVAGNYAGGKDREPDVDLLLGLLADPAPIVRTFSARGLGITYSRSAAELFEAGKDRVRARLVEMEKSEKDARVLEAIRKAVAGMGG